MLLALVIAAVAVIVSPAGGSASGQTLRSHPTQTTSPTWQLTYSDPGSFNAVSCATDRDCVAATTASGFDYVITYNGTDWGPMRLVGEYVGEVVSLSCPVAGWCAGITDRGAVMMLSNGHWSQLTTIDPNPARPFPGIANSISCETIRRCVAVDGQGNVETYDGRAWTTPTLIDRSYPLNDVSCVSNNFCIAVDGGGRVIELAGGRWTSPLPVDDAALAGVSCAVTDFCVAVDLFGRAVVHHGRTWSQPTAIDDALTSPLAVSCPAVGRCFVVDSEGREVVLDSGRWSPARAVRSANGLVSSLVGVSCPRGSMAFCAAVAAYSDALTTRDPFPRGG